MSQPAKGEKSQYDSIVKSLSLLARVTQRVLEDHAVTAANGSTVGGSKLHILKLLAHRGMQSTGQVARFLSISAPGVTQLANALVRHKLIVRKPDTRDRRTTFLALTPAGKKLVHAVEGQQRKLIRTALKNAGISNPARWIESVQHVTKGLADCDLTISEEFCLQCGAHLDGSCVLVGGQNVCNFLSSAAAQSERLRSRAPRRAKTASRQPAEPI